ncbi:RNA polymerase II-binding domain containing protein [Nitzschia inconspicua]|uniref:RNA polymerase II-binding domain containing protein n=1 Tax=Nitzschia inconspicua TaxID=303405 RepID=A0A9K3LCM2_9STRA|nr:RNA polymerase II-binding domain containing protein [Nitzschia inconspicua]
MSDTEDEIDQEQLDEYKEMVDDLGAFPDKVKINSLSMVAEDHADSSRSAAAIYNVIRQPLVAPNVHSDRKLPLVYVIDSILKNVKGEFIPIIENDAKNWMPLVYKALPDDKRVKLKKVWNLWKEAGVFSSTERWEEMGLCFSGVDANGGDALDHAALESGGISFGKDGGLVLMPSLRNAMQTILDDLQSDEQDELNKVSLERLAAIDPDLLIKIKRTAEESLRNGTSNSIDNSRSNSSTEQKKGKDELSFLVETRTPKTISRSQMWEKASLNYMKESHDIIASLNHLVLESSSIEKRYTQSEAIDMKGALATAAVTATLLTNAMQEMKDIADGSKKKKSKTTLTGGQSTTGASQVSARSFFKIDKTLFTNDGLKKLNEAVVGLLYEIGLPFVSSADGQRFATQIELSQHLDTLFKKSQLEKTMATTQERGWYDEDSIWRGDIKTKESMQESRRLDDDDNSEGPTAEDDNADPDSFTYPADESRDRCVICGINFRMFFDNDDGIYKYNQCREIEVLNDEAVATESDQMLVHVTCWRNLGSPEILTADQTIN